MLAPFFIPLDPPVFPSPKQFSLRGQAMPGGGAIQVTGCPTPREELSAPLEGAGGQSPVGVDPLFTLCPAPCSLGVSGREGHFVGSRPHTASSSPSPLTLKPPGYAQKTSE